MAQLHFTLDKDFFVGLFTKTREEAFGELIEALLNQFIQAESEEKLHAGSYERSGERTDYRNGIRERQINTRVGKITLKVPRHRNEPFHTSLIENYQRNEQALIATMMEMVIQGVATRNVEKITEELCGTSFSKATVSELCKGLDEEVFKFKNRELLNQYPFVMMDAMYIKVREDHRIRSKGLMIALGINQDGHKELIGFELCDTENKYDWSNFMKSLKNRGLTNVDIITSDHHDGLVAAIRETFPGSAWQRCQFHFMRNIMDKTPKKYQTGLATELREMFNAKSLDAAKEKRDEIINDYSDVAPNAMAILDEGFFDATNILSLPEKYRKTLRTSNLLERENQEIRKREKTIKVFPNQAAAIRLLGAVMMDHNDEWSTRSRVFSMRTYYENRGDIVVKLRAA